MVKPTKNNTMKLISILITILLSLNAHAGVVLDSITVIPNPVTYNSKAKIVFNYHSSIGGQRILTGQDLTDTATLYSACFWSPNWGNVIYYSDTIESETIKGYHKVRFSGYEGPIWQFACNNLTLDSVTYLNIINIPESIIHQGQYDTKIYPNPVKDYLIIESDKEILEVRLKDMQGRTIHIYKDLNLNLSHLQQGNYFLQIRTKESVTNYSIIKL